MQHGRRDHLLAAATLNESVACELFSAAAFFEAAGEEATAQALREQARSLRVAAVLCTAKAGGEAMGGDRDTA